MAYELVVLDAWPVWLAALATIALIGVPVGVVLAVNSDADDAFIMFLAGPIVAAALWVVVLALTATVCGMVDLWIWAIA